MKESSALNADLDTSASGYIMVLNADGSTPDGGFSRYTIDRIATLRIPNGTTTVESEAFANTPDNAVVYFPDSVTQIAGNAFSGVDGLVVVGYRNSTAQTFAQQNGYVFVPIQN